jgi:hypothetical protein
MKVLISLIAIGIATSAVAAPSRTEVREVDGLFQNLSRLSGRVNQNNFAASRSEFQELRRRALERATEVCRGEAACLQQLRIQNRLGAVSCYFDRWDRQLNGTPANPNFRVTFEQHGRQLQTHRGDCEALITAIDDNGRRPTAQPRPDAAPDGAQATAAQASSQLRGLKPESCKWVSELPRRIINAPGCTTGSRNRICTGFVRCEQRGGGPRLIRLSTCRAEYCGASDQDAVRCTEDPGYSSSRPQGETRDTVSPDFNRRAGTAVSQ